MAITDLYANSGLLGVALGQIWTPPDSTVYNAGDQPPLAIGTRVTATDGSVWVYVVLGVGGVTGTGYACVYDENFLAVMLSTGNDVYGDLVGIPACGAAIEDDRVWLQIAGVVAEMQVAASAAANVLLSPTATAGQLDDGATTGLFVRNAVLTTARGGTAGTAPGTINFPVVDTIPTPAP